MLCGTAVGKQGSKPAQAIVRGVEYHCKAADNALGDTWMTKGTEPTLKNLWSRSCVAVGRLEGSFTKHLATISRIACTAHDWDVNHVCTLLTGDAARPLISAAHTAG